MSAKGLKFIQVNIYKGRYLDSLLDFLKVQDPDFVSMQEVTAGQLNLCDKNLDLFELFKKELGLNGVIDKITKPVDSKNSYLGNAVFSKFEITNSEVLVLKTFEGLTLAKFDKVENFPLFSRHLISAECIINSRKVHAISWHGTWTAPPEDTAETLRQAGEVANYLQGLNAPFILGCDMNAVPQSKTAGLISAVANNLMMNSGVLQTTQPKIHKIAPRGFLVDYIFTSSHFKLKKLEVPEVTISDHLPVVGELEFNPED